MRRRVSWTFDVTVVYFYKNSYSLHPQFENARSLDMTIVLVGLFKWIYCLQINPRRRQSSSQMLHMKYAICNDK